MEDDLLDLALSRTKTCRPMNTQVITTGIERKEKMDSRGENEE
jgi:hypothetical protein